MKEIHFWNLKDNFCVRIEEDFMKTILLKASPFNIPFYKLAKEMNINESILREIKNKPSKKIEIRTLFKILEFLKTTGFEPNLDNVECHIKWIGNKVGRGITNPKLPFKIETPQFSTLLAASFGDGTITNISYSAPEKYKLGVFEYSNEELVLREKLIQSSIEIFGGNLNSYIQRPNRNSVSIFFPSVIRDTILLAGGEQGEKTVSNPRVPKIIINSSKKKIWINWLKQTMDDEGSVRFRKNFSHEVYITRASDITEDFLKQLNPETKIPLGKLSKKEQEVIVQNPNNLLVDELKLFNRLGIEGRLRPQEIYVTKKGEIKVKWRLYITRKDNIKKFARIIGFRIPRKQMILRKIIGDKLEVGTKNKRK